MISKKQLIEFIESLDIGYAEIVEEQIAPVPNFDITTGERLGPFIHDRKHSIPQPQKRCFCLAITNTPLGVSERKQVTESRGE